MAGAVSGAAGYKVEAGAEIGVAIDLAGEKTCYIGGCITEGFDLPPQVGGDAGISIAVTLWLPVDGQDGMSNIPGGMNIMAVGAEGEIALGPVSLSLGGGVNYFYNPELQNIKGLGVEMDLEVGASQPKPPVGGSVSFGLGQCFTPICLSTEGKPCGTGQLYGAGNGFPWSASDVAAACPSVPDGPGPSWCAAGWRCPGWAWDCNGNPGYMHQCCRQTCGICGASEASLLQATANSSKPEPDPAPAPSAPSPMKAEA
jgi:hypothetical protein